MTIEEALTIINNTNFYSHFSNEKQDEAFDMAFRALKQFNEIKEDVRQLRLMKDHTSIVLACMFSNLISQVEDGSGDNGK